MSNVYLWYGVDFKRSASKSIQNAFEEWLNLIKKELHNYFQVSQSETLQELLDKSSNDSYFVEWFKAIGFSSLHQLNIERVSEEERFVSFIEFDKYLIENEHEWEDEHKNMRGTLISAIKDMPETMRMLY
ncbi:hypothetical protein HKK70_08715 [Bacillus safensis]|uniref:hypothetical protein n=1 Tax=Bacillus safensis TaxID=561879 RepID=UPI001469F9E8|nr:hypothetical protein [Bacillus safensis]MCM3366023.1 hypothetical protein [Bacillus safensis]NMW01846.1 hypothetical protein [Bacillus safensis]